MCLHWQRLSGHAVFIGIIAGLAITFGLYLTGWGGARGSITDYSD